MNKFKVFLVALFMVGALMSLPNQAHAAVSYPDPAPVVCPVSVVDNQKFNISFLVYRWHIVAQDASSVTYQLQLDINPTNNETWVNVAGQTRVVSIPNCAPPVVVGNGGTPPTFQGSTTDAPPVCVDPTIGRVPWAAVLQGTPNDGIVTINWALPVNAQAVHIIYREDGRGWEHALRNAPNDGHAVISSLKNGVLYHFVVVGIKNCDIGSASGQVSAEYQGKP